MTDGNRLALNLTGTAVALLVVSLFGGAIYALVQVQVPDANQNALLVLLGALTSNVTSVVAFFFGSSSGDKAKNDTIATQATTAAKAQDALVPLVGSTPTIPVAEGEKVVVEGKGDPK